MSPAPIPRLSVVVPTLNEAETLPLLFGDLAPLVARGDVEVVVADGGSVDGTQEVAAAHGARVVQATPGRGQQLRAGVAAAGAPNLWILHADARIPGGTIATIREQVTDGLVRPWACRLVIDGDRWALRLIAAGANLRSRWWGLPYGDQGLLIPRHLLDAAGGYDDIPLMEDVALALRLRRFAPIQILPASIHISARRWLRDGPWRRSARNVWLLLRFLTGADPAVLAAEYRAPTGARPVPDA
jgi:rSAM/selenodomain-associated transferase 2